MESRANVRESDALEGYLQDLICAVGDPVQVGVLVEVLMALQLRPSVIRSARRRTLSASPGSSVSASENANV